MKLKEGSFYWVIPVRCPDIDDDWMQEKQPARYRGEDQFDFIGSEEPWPARWIGDEISGDLNVSA